MQVQSERTVLEGQSPAREVKQTVLRDFLECQRLPDLLLQVLSVGDSNLVPHFPYLQGVGEKAPN